MISRHGISSIADSQVSYTTRSANNLFAGPASGSDAVPTWRSLVAKDLPTLDSASAELGTIFDVSSTAYQNTGLFLNLPSKGRYILIAEIRNLVNSAVGFGYLFFKLHNSTDATDVPQSQRFGAFSSSTGLPYYANTIILCPFTANAAKTI